MENRKELVIVFCCNINFVLYFVVMFVLILENSFLVVVVYFYVIDDNINFESK